MNTSPCGGRAIIIHSAISLKRQLPRAQVPVKDERGNFGWSEDHVMTFREVKLQIL